MQLFHLQLCATRATKSAQCYILESELNILSLSLSLNVLQCFWSENIFKSYYDKLRSNWNKMALHILNNDYAFSQETLNTPAPVVGVIKLYDCSRLLAIWYSLRSLSAWLLICWQRHWTLTNSSVCCHPTEYVTTSIWLTCPLYSICSRWMLRIQWMLTTFLTN